MALHHHFGGRLPDQEEALLAWTTSFLRKEPLAAVDLVRRFTDKSCVPQPIAIERQEAEQLLRLGVSSGKFLLNKNNQYELRPDEAAHLLRADEQARRDSAKARTAFRLNVLERFPMMHEQSIEESWLGLQQFTLAAVLGYINKTAALDNHWSALALIDDIFEPGTTHHRVASALYADFLQTVPDGKNLFATALSSAIYAFRTSISDGAQADIHRALKYRVLYLDTNVLFSVVGLRGEPEFEEATRRLLELACRQGFTLLYTAATKREFLEALDRFGKRFRSSNTIDHEPHYVTNRRKGSISRAYFLQRQDRTVEEFLNYYCDLPERLKGLTKLRVYEANFSKDQENALLESDLFDTVIEALQPIDYDRFRREHDAYNIALVMLERGGSEHFSDTPSWLLTHHRALTHANRRLNVRFPVVMTLDSWVLHFRKFLPRVDDFDSFLLDMIRNNVLSEFRLDDKQVEAASRYLQAGTNREAEEVISSLFQRIPFTALQDALESGEDADAVARLILEHDKNLLERLDSESRQLLTAEAERSQQQVAGIQEVLDKTNERLQEVEQRDQTKDKALHGYTNARKAHDVILKALSEREAQAREARDNLAQVNQSRRWLRRGVAATVFILSSAVMWQVMDLPSESNTVQHLTYLGITPGLLASLGWWLSRYILGGRIDQLSSESEKLDQEVASLRSELQVRKAGLEASAGAAGLR